MMHRWLLSQVSISSLIVIAAVAAPMLGMPLVPGAGFHDNQRIIEILCVALSAIIFSQSRNLSIKKIYDSQQNWLITFFFLFGLISCAAAYSPRYAFFEWANFLLLFGVSRLIALEISIQGEGLLNKILKLCCWGCASYVFIEIIIYVAVIKVGYQPSNSMLFFGFDNYRFFNHVQTITLPLLGLFISLSKNERQKILAWSVASTWWGLLFVSAGRGTFVGIVVGMCVAWLCFGKDFLPWCCVMLRSALIGLGIYFLFYVLVPMSLGMQPFGLMFSIVGRTFGNPDSSRWPLWVRAWEIMITHPWLGAGPLHFAHFGRAVQGGAHPHNWVLQIASEWGIPALLCLATAIILGLKKLLAVRQYLSPTDKSNRLTLAALLTAAVAILVDGLVSGLIVMPISQLWIAVYIGFTWGWVTLMIPIRAETTSRLSTMARIYRLASALVLICFLGNGLWPEISNLPLHEEQNLQKNLYADPIFRPRIWRAGYF